MRHNMFLVLPCVLPWSIAFASVALVRLQGAVRRALLAPMDGCTNAAQSCIAASNFCTSAVVVITCVESGIQRVAFPSFACLGFGMIFNLFFLSFFAGVTGLLWHVVE
eukprot:TRINITY_DN21232_c0_g1_i2.p2 TRINITY_DN21232_c0_g1~~TRINITY_DN21232_c0_g1_i2.p2  ORF type:complete len:108 (-),score=2.26 TRINITY_DN21232_c0_g1_i2:80-403(-)